MINNIPTFLIACDELADRKNATFEHLYKNNVDFTYWRGFYGNGSGIATSKVYYYENEDESSGVYITPNGVSLCLNHLFLYQHCLANNYEQVVILEDDVNLEDKWQERMYSMLENLPNDYDIVYLGWCHEKHERKYKHVADCLYNEINDCIFGTHALLISKNGLKILSETLRKIEKPIDVSICYNSLAHMKYFLCYPSIITQKSQSEPQDKIWESSL
jgi:GR25 family glycosyltransferase involved in LPS biosynthesis